MSNDLNPEMQSVVQKVEKLLRLAARNPNEAEAASATAKAMELLAAHNLDMAAVEQNSGDSGKRAAENLEGGRFEWERDLWRSVAELNFCLYWNQVVFIKTPLGSLMKYMKRKSDGEYVRVKGLNQHQHKVVGRTVNIAATKSMASYLQDVADRLTREKCKSNGQSVRSRWSNSFREGIVTRICEKIYDRRRDLIAEETRKKRDAEKAALKSERAGVSSSTAIAISTYVQTERDANIDFEYGEGTSAKWAAERAAKAAAARAADEEYTRWAAANPKEAAKEEARRKKEAEREERRQARSGQNYKGDIGAFFAGYDAGDEVSLDLQTEGRKARAFIQ